MKTKLYHGLPSVYNDERLYWIIYSPYIKKIARIPESKIGDIKTFDKLECMSFFGTPAKSSVCSTAWFQLTLILTNDCQLACTYCYEQGSKSKRMDIQIALEKTKETMMEYPGKKDGKSLYIDFFGGEPTLHPECIVAVVEFALKNRVKYNIPSLGFGITTNGIIDNKLLTFMIKHNFHFTVSTDGLPLVQNSTRPFIDGSPSSQFIEETIKTIVLLLPENIERVRATVTQDTVFCMPESVRYFARLGVKKIHFEPAFDPGISRITRGTFESVSSKDFIKYFSIAMDVAAELNIILYNSSFINIMHPSTNWCEGIARSKRIISYTGNDTTCLEVHDEEHPFSEHFLKDGFSNDTALINIEGIKTIEKCKDCFARYVCSSGCPIKNYYESGDFFEGDTRRCSITKNFLKEFIINMDDSTRISKKILTFENK